MGAILGQQTRTLADLVSNLLGAIVRNDNDLARLLGVFDSNPSADFGDRRHTLGGASLEEFDHAGKAVRDVLTRDTSGVEGAHGQLRSRLADGLRRDDADCFADVHQLAGSHR